MTQYFYGLFVIEVNGVTCEASHHADFISVSISVVGFTRIGLSFFLQVSSCILLLIVMLLNINAAIYT